MFPTTDEIGNRIDILNKTENSRFVAEKSRFVAFKNSFWAKNTKKNWKMDESSRVKDDTIDIDWRI